VRRAHRLALPAGVAIALFAACRPAPIPPAPAPEFSAPVFASDNDQYGASEPTLWADSHGNLAAAWIDWTPPHPRIRVATSSNGGASFTRSRLLSPDDAAHGDGQADVSLASTGDGRLFVSWLACRHDEDAPTNSACDVEAAVSRDAGLSWTALPAIATGGAAHRERDWLAAANGRVWASWTENLAHGAEWVVAVDSAGRFAERARVRGKASLSGPIVEMGGALDVLLMDRPSPKPGEVWLERRRSKDAGRTWETEGTISFDRAAALLPYSMGMLGAAGGGGEWVAIPRGDGTENDFVLGWRPPALDVFRTAPTLRVSPRARVGMPWFSPRPDGTTLVAWIEEGDDGWRVMARLLTDHQHRTAAADLSRAPFRFQEASLTENIGDYLAIATAGTSSWVAFSDTTAGRARIRCSRLSVQGRAAVGLHPR